MVSCMRRLIKCIVSCMVCILYMYHTPVPTVYLHCFLGFIIYYHGFMIFNIVSDGRLLDILLKYIYNFIIMFLEPQTDLSGVSMCAIKTSNFSFFGWILYCFTLYRFRKKLKSPVLCSMSKIWTEGWRSHGNIKLGKPRFMRPSTLDSYFWYGTKRVI